MFRNPRTISALAFALTLVGFMFAVGCDESAGDPSAPAATSQPQRRVPDKPAGPDADSLLVDAFKAHRADFDELRTMMLADLAAVREVRTGPDATKPAGLSEERYRLYLARLEQSGVRAVSTQGDDLSPGDVRFEVAPPAGWPPESQAYILYAEATGLQRVEIIADRLSAAKGVQVARELDLKWYLVGRN